MPSPRRRPKVQVPSDEHERRKWEASRARDMFAALGSGLGTRPPGWWRFESSRPDLADGARLDADNHLRPGTDAAAATVERLRIP
jgi:hypothetical protein